MAHKQVTHAPRVYCIVYSYMLYYSLHYIYTLRLLYCIYLLYKYGIYYTIHNTGGRGDSTVISYLSDALRNAGTNDIVQHGACLGT